jgi:hypothetical protein
LGFDGSYSGDATAIVAVQIGDMPHLDVVRLWEDVGGQMPIIDVEDALRIACKPWRVQEIVADPFRWARSLQLLADEGLPVEEFPQSPARMTPATQRFGEAVLNKALTHSGDPDLARHVGNAVVKNDSRGASDCEGTQRLHPPHRLGGGCGDGVRGRSVGGDATADLCVRLKRDSPGVGVNACFLIPFGRRRGSPWLAGLVIRPSPTRASPRSTSRRSRPVRLRRRARRARRARPVARHR